MIYFKVTDDKGKVYAKSLKSYEEAETLGRKLVDELKCDITVWSTKPYKKTANFYEYGYHNMVTFCYHAPVQEKEAEEMFTLHFVRDGEKVDTEPMNKRNIDLVIQYGLDNGKIPYEVRKVN